MNPLQIIAQKRDGHELSYDQISFFIQGFAAGRIPHFQMSALTMALYLKGMSTRETIALTRELVGSGRTMAWTSPSSSPAENVSAEQDLVARLEKIAQKGGGDLPDIGTIALDVDPVSDLDARDTVDLGEDTPASLTVMLDGTPKGLDGSARDTLDLESSAPAPPPVYAGTGQVVDRLSTGGLGEKTSLILAPLLACCGLRVPMISGRGPGATGGMLDRLESIPGFRTDLSLEEIRRVTEQIGCVITGPTAELVPADRKLYAVRDASATLDSIPLMAASGMAKKLAEGLDALVLDIKWGVGGFMKSLPAARQLAEAMLDIGGDSGLATVAILTNMDQPLGRMIGNTLEVDEALEVLAGRGPEDVWQLSRELGVSLLLATGSAPHADAAREILTGHIVSGRAMTKFRELVTAQGGNLDVPRPRCGFQFDLRAARSGYVCRINPDALEATLVELGGGRRVPADAIDHSVGLEMLVRLGDQVETGQALVRIHCREDQTEAVKPLLRTAIAIRPEPVDAPLLITDRITR